jgi:outer membrane biogenesis lipoprotein LolB
MSARYFCAVLGLSGALLTGCTTTTTTTAQTETDQTKKRVHTQEELRKSGETDTGRALEKTDPAIRTEGSH